MKKIRNNSNAKKIPLDGTWKASWFDGQRGCYQNGIDSPDADLSCYIDANVPGEIHQDLVREGIIKDPSVEANCVAARWVEECIWTYRREIDVPAEALKGRSWLVFEELSYAADIRLNGEKLAKHANFFHPCRIETTGKLKKGKNLLTVHLDGGLFAVSDKPYEGYGLSLDAKLHKRHWLRKPQSEFAWDWSPRLINVGIGKPVRLEWTADKARLDRFVPLIKMHEGLQKAKLVARLTTVHTALGVGSFFCETWSNYYPLDLSLLRRSFAADPVSPQQPQAAYYVMRNLATALADLQPAELKCRLEGGPASAEMFAMSRPGEHVVTLWQQGRATDVCLGTPADLLVRGRYRRVIGYDPLNGVEQELHAERIDGRTRISGLLVKDYPMLLRFEIET